MQGSFSSPDTLVGRGLIQPVHANEPLTENKLAPVEAGAGLPPSIPPGMRALSVKVNDVIGVAGFVMPGTRVDVLVTLEPWRSEHVAGRREQRPGADGRHAVRPGAGEGRQADPVDRRDPDGHPGGRRADRAGADSGPIMLTLRNPLDMVPTDTSGVRMASLLGAPDPRRS